MDVLRRVFVTQTGSLGAASSLDLGVFPVGQYPRLTGIVQLNNSSTVQFRFQAFSGSTLITSALATTSGPNRFNVANEANFVGVAITPVASLTPYTIMVAGEMTR